MLRDEIRFIGKDRGIDRYKLFGVGIIVAKDGKVRGKDEWKYRIILTSAQGSFLINYRSHMKKIGNNSIAKCLEESNSKELLMWVLR